MMVGFVSRVEKGLGGKECSVMWPVSEKHICVGILFGMITTRDCPRGAFSRLSWVLTKPVRLIFLG